ncbi:hypothetical protein MKX03_019680, partial [Papaver bracteatum]
IMENVNRMGKNLKIMLDEKKLRLSQIQLVMGILGVSFTAVAAVAGVAINFV